MSQCDVQDLADDAKCLFGVSLPGQSDAIELALLCRILKSLNPQASCDVQSLADRSKCFLSVAMGGQYEALYIQLLCEIKDNISNDVGETHILMDETFEDMSLSSDIEVEQGEGDIFVEQLSPGNPGYLWDGTVDKEYFTTLDKDPNLQGPEYYVFPVRLKVEQAFGSPAPFTAPFTWDISSGSLPPGLSLESTTSEFCRIQGTPTLAGYYEFTVRVTSSEGWQAFFTPVIGAKMNIYPALEIVEIAQVLSMLAAANDFSTSDGLMLAQGNAVNTINFATESADGTLYVGGVWRNVGGTSFRHIVQRPGPALVIVPSYRISIGGTTWTAAPGTVDGTYDWVSCSGEDCVDPNPYDPPVAPDPLTLAEL